MRTLAALALALLAGFAVGRLSAPKADTELRIAGRWIQVYHAGQLAAELDERDGETWEILLATCTDELRLPACLRPTWATWKHGLGTPSERPLEAP